MENFESAPDSRIQIDQLAPLLTFLAFHIMKKNRNLFSRELGDYFNFKLDHSVCLMENNPTPTILLLNT